MQVLRHSQITGTMQVYSEVPSDATKDPLQAAAREPRWLQGLNCQDFDDVGVLGVSW